MFENIHSPIGPYMNGINHLDIVYAYAGSVNMFKNRNNLVNQPRVVKDNY